MNTKLIELADENARLNDEISKLKAEKEEAAKRQSELEVEVAKVVELVAENSNLKRKSAHESRLNVDHLERIKRLQAIIANLKRENAVMSETAPSLPDRGGIGR